MSNLSELLPTGGGQNAVDFVASGTLASGQTVILRSDGKVEAVAAVAQGFGSAVIFESATTTYTATTYDSFNNKVVVAYTDVGNSNYGTAVVGTVSGTTISFGTPVVFSSITSNFISATFDSNASKVVFVFRYNSVSGRGIVGTVSGTSISFGSQGIFDFGDVSETSITFDSSANKVVIAYRDRDNSSFGTAIVGTVSGTSISYGTPVIFESDTTVYTSITYDSVNNKVVIAYQDAGNNGYGKAVVGTVSGTSISFGAIVTFSTVNTTFNSATFDSNANKVVIAYRDGTPPYYGRAIVGEVSGTSISFGTSVIFTIGDNYYHSIVFDTNSKQVVIAYNDYANLDSRVIVGTVSGTSISFGTPVVFLAGNTSFISSVFDSTENKVVISCRDQSNLDYGTGIVFQPFSTNSAGFIGITASAIADTATGAVNVYGGINEAQTGLTIGSDYYVQADGSLSTTASAVKVGKAISATTINMMDLT